MKMRFLVIAVVLAALALGGVSYAATTTDTTTTTSSTPDKRGGGPGGHGGPGGSIADIAKAAGMSVEDLMKERQAGKSFREILTAKGVDVDALIDKLVAAWKEDLEEKIDDTSALPTPPARDGVPGHHGTIEAIAKAANMSVEDLMKERKAGKSFKEILTAKSVDVDALVKEIVAAAKADLDKLVADGKMSQEQATERLTKFQTHLEKMLTDTSALPEPKARGEKPTKSESTK